MLIPVLYIVFVISYVLIRNLTNLQAIFGQYRGYLITNLIIGATLKEANCYLQYSCLEYLHLTMEDKMLK